MEKEYDILPEDRLCIGALRSLVIDETNNAKSGHPGMALDIAPTLYTLFKNHLVAYPKEPKWINRDRFVLSSGHNSALLYAMLHLAGYDVSMDDLKAFRSLDSKTPGHPEVTITPGVDATAGPLGQGIAQAVGMAMAEAALAARYPDGSEIFDHRTYCLCGDGCLEEGISQEAISLAGLHRLNKLILIYDANTSTLDGPTTNSMIEDIRLRFMACQWNVFDVRDGNDVASVDKALTKARESRVFPSLIIVHTEIGYGSANQGSHKTHGSPLGTDDGNHAKAVFGYTYPEFTVPEDVYQTFHFSFFERGQKSFEEWKKRYDEYSVIHPQETKIIEDSFARNLAPYLPQRKEFAIGSSIATRAASGKYLTELVKTLPFTLGGSADVAGSTMTAIPGDPDFTYEHRFAKNVNYGIREFAMAAVNNGILLHGGLVTYCGVFLIFSDYMRPAIRMAALEELPSIYIMTHDSIAVGEDGSTHQPIEQTASLRLIPNVSVIRPCDERETFAAWEVALKEKDKPTCLILSRQKLALEPGSSYEGVEKGAYIISPANGYSRLELIATGSEVGLAIKAQALLREKGIEVEVVSMPSVDIFEKQDDDYKNEVLNLEKRYRVAIEMGTGEAWYKYADNVISIERFGKSAPGDVLLKEYGFTPEEIAEKLESLLD
ncbi:MAG: transketolase [Bacilli bacterium]|nr:transketolase [Bacilli bacterium]